MSLPLVSVYMTVKNGMPYLESAIESVFSQTYPNIELILIDDNSSSETLEFLNRLEDSSRSDKRKIKIIYTNGLGRSRSLNLALDSCNGFYVANLDADDLFHEEKISAQVRLMELMNLDFLCSGSKVFSDGVEVENIKNAELGKINAQKINGNLFLRDIHHSSVMVRRTLLDEKFRYDESRSAQIDYALWFSLDLQGTDLFKADAILSYKRVHENQSFESKKRFQYLYSAFKLKQSYLSRKKAGLYWYFVLYIKFIYGLLPQKFRKSIKQISLFKF